VKWREGQLGRGGEVDKSHIMGERHAYRGRKREEKTAQEERKRKTFFQKMGCEKKNGEWMKYG
jgi:hypothetical protein